ncbi:MAG: hypothetical protein ACRDJS_02610 [Actinomycetota bacterium]
MGRGGDSEPCGGGKAGLSQGIAGFLVYQAMVGSAFGLGFLLLHNQIWTWLSAGAERGGRHERKDGELTGS